MLKLTCYILFVISISCNAQRARRLVEFQASNLTTNFQGWEYDMAIMFYAPWCKYCKQLTPYMESMAIQSKDNKELAIGRFNCDEPKTHRVLCEQLGVTHYPSVYFVGYGDFNQAPPKNIFGESEFPRLVHYRADLLPDAIYDWITMLTTVSWVHRKWDDLLSFLIPSKSRQLKRINSLQAQISSLENKVDKYKEVVAQYKADEIFDSLKEGNDPFPLLNELPVDDSSLPLRLCVADMAEEYCKYHVKDEKFCTTMELHDCINTYMRPKECRPAACPFTHIRGLKAVSVCTDPDIINQYIDALKDDSSSSGGSSNSGSSTKK